MSNCYSFVLILSFVFLDNPIDVSMIDDLVSAEGKTILSCTCMLC